MKAITSRTSREELCAAVVDSLAGEGISAVLVGGAVVSIFTENEYESRDLDFITSASHQRIAKAMKAIGFEPRGRDFVHKKSKFTVEFPLGPLAIGNLEPVKPEGKLNVNGTEISLLSPTQAVMDRLCWFYFNNDRQCLDQAVAICLKQSVNLNRVRKWSRDEDEEEKFSVFLNHLEERKKRRR